MFVVSVATLRSALQFDDMAKVNAACAAALTSATEALASELRTALEAGAAVDTFYVRPGAGLRFGSGMAEVWRARLALRYGFVTGTPVIAYAPSLATLTSAPTTLAADQYILHAAKGELILEGPDLRNQYVRVTYNHGFPADAGDAAAFDQALIPEWLRQAALTYAIMSLRERNPDLVGEEAAKASDRKTEAFGLVTQHVRYFPNAIRPI